MGLKEIEYRLDVIEKKIFEYSFQKSISLQKLSSVYFDLINIKNWFIKLNFMEVEQEELEGSRYRINEGILNVKILIREIKGLSIDSEIRQMEELIK